ncbi:MAG: STM4015 family protein [Chloroflexales bacterium]
MSFYEHLTQFAGLTVVDWNPNGGVVAAGYALRLALSYNTAQAGTQWSDQFVTLLAHPDVAALAGLVVGAWGEMFDQSAEAARVVEALVAARDRLPNLRAIFFGDVISEECEISWIQNTDMSPLLSAYPQLEHFGVRGSNSLSFGALQHLNLRSLTVQSGGLPAGVVRAIAAAELPALEHLELWLGTPNYDGDATVEDLAPILAGDRFPRLRYLGLRNSELADEIAVALANAPVLEQLHVLDLSLGTLGDEGATALLASPATARLEKLDLHHHYCSPAVVAQLAALPLSVDTSEPEAPDIYGGERHRYVAVSE